MRSDTDMIVTVVRADLWGNERDGFDWNDSFKIGTVAVKGEPTERRLTTIARDHFAGYELARTESLSLPMTRRGIAVEWQDKGVFDVVYRGSIVGRLDVDPGPQDPPRSYPGISLP